MRNLSIRRLLLLKRVRSVVSAPTLSDLDSLGHRLRRDFPEYQRQPKKEFFKVLKALLSEECQITVVSSDSLTKNEDSNGDLTAEDEEDGTINDAIADFMVSEGTEKVNQTLRNLYGLETNLTVKVEASNTNSEAVASKTTNSKRSLSQEQIPSQRKRPKKEEKRKPVKKRIEKNVGEGTKISNADASNGDMDLSPSSSFLTTPKNISYSQLGGLEDVLSEIKELVEYPLKHPEVYDWLGVEPPHGILLHGPPGCGKTALAHAIAHECRVPFFKIAAPEIVSGMSGESEGKIRTLFSEALNFFPSIIFIDEIDAIASKRENVQREMERRIVAQLLTCMDDLSNPQSNEEIIISPRDNDDTVLVEANRKKHVVVMGATNRPDVLDPALRRAGRFDREISLGIPNEAARVKILNVMCKKLRLEGVFDFALIARKTPGFVAADLEALTREAAAIAVTRIFDNLQENPKIPKESQSPQSRFGAGPLTPEELQGLKITMEDFVVALTKVQPSLGREGFTTKPDITWTDIGSLNDIREELSFAICQPILHPEHFESMGLSLASGVLLYGPPGCGKTLVAKAVANEAGTNFISIKGPELLNKYVGESERAVRQLFNRARAAKPCVLFFDEMDALAPKRGMDNNQAAERLVNQLLTEMDGIDGREGVYLIAATNRPDIIDPALLRPGRLDKILFVPLPDAEGRISILKTLSRKCPVDSKVDLIRIAKDPCCEGFSGADLSALVREACVLALKEDLTVAGEKKTEHTMVKQRHFERAMQNVKPSVSEIDVSKYAHMKSTLRKSRGSVKS